VFAALATVLVLVLTINAYATFIRQSPGGRPWLSVDSLRTFLPAELADRDLIREYWTVPGDHVLNHMLPPGSRVYFVADIGRVFYIDGPVGDRFIYHTAFDANPLGELIEEHSGDPQRIIAALRQQGVTHLWVGWSELNRLQSSYGYDPRVTVERIIAIGDRRVNRQDFGPPGRAPWATLYALPRSTP
jgi:hypothetical protein